MNFDLDDGQREFASMAAKFYAANAGPGRPDHSVVSADDLRESVGVEGLDVRDECVRPRGFDI